MILGLFPELTTPGGVQRVGRHVALVLSSIARQQKLACYLLSLNDPPGRHALKVGECTIEIQGFGRSKARFVLAMLGAAPLTHLAYLAHPNLAPLGLLLRILQPGARYCVTGHGIDVWERLPLLRRLSLRFAHAVTSPSLFTAEKMIRIQKLDPRKVTVLPWALDPAFLSTDGSSAPPKLSMPPGKVLMTVARLAVSEQYKGIETVIQALPRILSVVPDTYYVIVGDGDDRVRLERLAKDTGVANRVLFAGRTDDKQLASYYESCDIFVMPSSGEGFGVVFLEAMAFGKPVIGGNHGGTPEVVTEGMTGFLVEYGDVSTLTDRIVRLLSDEELRTRMSEASRRWVQQNSSFDHFRKELSRLLTGSN